MTMTLEQRRDLAEASGRFTMYSLLASGLAFPSKYRMELLGSRLIPAVQTIDFGGPFAGAVDRLALVIPEDYEEARRHYMSLFPPIASQDAPGYETGYRGDGIFQQSAIMADIAGFYRAHGLRAGGAERERTDHITVELEFMAFVAKKEALALQRGWVDKAEACRDTAALFLQDHLGCWAPAFGRRVAAVTASLWLREIGSLVTLWVEDELAAFAVDPLEVVERPLPMEPRDDGSCGPCPVGVSE